MRGSRHVYDSWSASHLLRFSTWRVSIRHLARAREFAGCHLAGRMALLQSNSFPFTGDLHAYTRSD